VSVIFSISLFIAYSSGQIPLAKKSEESNLQKVIAQKRIQSNRVLTKNSKLAPQNQILNQTNFQNFTHVNLNKQALFAKSGLNYYTHSERIPNSTLYLLKSHKLKNQEPLHSK
jgi:hypothetical protein